MLLKLIGSVLVVFTGGYMGFMLANRCRERPDNLRQLLSCIVSLKSYMNYTAMPLSDGLMNCATGANQKVTTFFTSAAALLKNNYTLSPKEAIMRTLSVEQGKLALTKEDCEVLILFGSNLGIMDRTEQQNYLTMIEKRLEILEREAVSTRDRNCKMYRYLGICGSLMVVLLLL